MAKEAYYFSHDLGARNDPKLQKVLMRHGQAGKGVFWDLVEMLFEEGGRLLLSDIESYAFALRTTNDIIMSLISDFGLFDKDDRFFWSNSVGRRIEERNSKSQKARESAQERWSRANALKLDANALRIECEGNAIKEKKGKEIKEEKSIVELVSPTPTKKDISSRKDDFKKDLSAYLETYGKEMLNAFFKYWAEMNKTKTKMKFEMEKTWEINLRLSKWSNNDFGKSKSNIQLSNNNVGN